MSAWMLVVLAQVAQPVDTTDWDSDQRFWYAMTTALVPIGLGLLTLLGTVVTGLLARQAVRQAGVAAQTAGVAVAKVDANTAITAATAEELGKVSKAVDGQGEELRSLTARAAHAEGKLEGRDQASVPAPVPPIVNVLVPSAPPVVAPPQRSPETRSRASDQAPPAGPDPPRPP